MIDIEIYTHIWCDSWLVRIYPNRWWNALARYEFSDNWRTVNRLQRITCNCFGINSTFFQLPIFLLCLWWNQFIWWVQMKEENSLESILPYAVANHSQTMRCVRIEHDRWVWTNLKPTEDSNSLHFGEERARILPFTSKLSQYYWLKRCLEVHQDVLVSRKFIATSLRLHFGYSSSSVPIFHACTRFSPFA